jgi:hypothetical protein
MVLPALPLTPQELVSGAGGIAAAIATGAFIGQAFTGFSPASEQKRRRDIAIGGLTGFALLIGLFLWSAK